MRLNSRRKEEQIVLMKIYKDIYYKIHKYFVGKSTFNERLKQIHESINDSMLKFTLKFKLYFKRRNFVITSFILHNSQYTSDESLT